MASSRVALVTGASSGIGYALAKVLAVEEGYAVGLVARRLDRLEALAADIESAGGKAVVVEADVGDREAMHGAVSSVADALGPIDLFVANAGISIPTLALEPDAATLEAEVRVNLFGAYYGIEAVVPSMRDRGQGHIVAISSLANRRGFPRSGGYSATKAALSRLMESLRLEWAKVGIRATTVHPGFVESEITEELDHALPFLMPADKAARKIARAIRRGRKTYDFPWPTALLARLAPLLPDWFLRRIR